jgi:hypothetical protein
MSHQWHLGIVDFGFIHFAIELFGAAWFLVSCVLSGAAMFAAVAGDVIVSVVIGSDVAVDSETVVISGAAAIWAVDTLSGVDAVSEIVAVSTALAAAAAFASATALARCTMSFTSYGNF